MMVIRTVLCVALLVGGASSLALAPSRNTIRFRQMCDTFASHPPSLLAGVASDKKRLLCLAAASALGDERIVDAISILYEDLAPVRIAGDLIFRKLEAAVADAEARAPAEPVESAETSALPPLDEAALTDALRHALREWPEAVADQTVARLVADAARTHASLAGARRVFDAVDVGQQGALDADALERLGTAVRSFGQCAECTCEKRGSCASVTSLMEEVEAEEGLVFSEFILGYLDRFPNTRLLADRNDALVDELLNAGAAATGGPEAALGPASSRAGGKFDVMVDEVRGWAADREGVLRRAEKVNPRLATVLDGCFAGVEKPEVVRAFGVVFESYAAFRLAGSLIFKLMRKLVGTPVVDDAEPKIPVDAAPAPPLAETRRINPAAEDAAGVDRDNAAADRDDVGADHHAARAELPPQAGPARRGLARLFRRRTSS